MIPEHTYDPTKYEYLELPHTDRRLIVVGVSMFVGEFLGLLAILGRAAVKIAPLLS